MNLNMLGLGMFFLIGGIINLRAAKNKSYSGINWRIWAKLYGESYTRNVYLFQGVVFTVLGILFIFDAFK